MRRDLRRFLTLIEVSAILHQFQRERYEENGREYLVASDEDYAIAFDLASGILQQTIKQLSPKAEELLHKIKELSEEIDGETFTRRQIRESVGWDMKTITRYLSRCLDLGFVEIVAGGKGTPYQYRFIRLPDDQDNLLLHPDGLRCLLQERDLSKLGKPVQIANGQVKSLGDNLIGAPVQPNQRKPDRLSVTDHGAVSEMKSATQERGGNLG